MMPKNQQKNEREELSPLTRNHSLRYADGTLHMANPVSFDHTYKQISMDDSKDLHPSAKVQSSQLSPIPGSITTTPVKIPRVRSMIVRRRRRRVSSGDDEDDEDDEEIEARAANLYFTPPCQTLLNIPSECSSRDTLSAKSRSLNNLSSAGRAPIKTARGRSFLLGSVGPTSLLGVEELERFFPGRILKLFVGTWNMNGEAPPRHLADFLLPENIDCVPDVLVIGTQETFPERNEWEVRLQDTLGPSHVLFHSQSLGTLHLAIFLRRDLIWFCSVPDMDSFSTRPGVQFNTKGAIAVSLLIFGTSFLFVNCHLTAHEENVKDRIKDLTKLNAMLNLPKLLPLRKRTGNLCDNFDVVFWSGDLNFRLGQTREVVVQKVEDGKSVLHFDQLNYLRNEAKLIFKGFNESPIDFPPTYKYDLGSNDFDTSSKQRTPSYTDRILFKSNGTPIRPLHYDSVHGVHTSDHKPVWGMWEVKIRPGKDSIPLAGGLFNREVYLEGLKRRAESLQPHLTGKVLDKVICSIQ